MKKSLVAGFMTTALGFTASAGTISLDSRADYEATTYNDAAKLALGRRDNNRFVLTTLRLDSKGNLNDQTSFRLRFRLNRGTLGNIDAQDNLNSAIDFAFIQHNLVENFGIQIGKFGTDIGGIEGMTNSADLYLKSQAYGGGTLTTTAAGGTVSYAESENYRYATGLKGIYKLSEQEFELMVLNQETPAVDAPAGGKFYQSRHGYGLVWKGSFLDQTLKPVLSWHQDNLQTQAANSAVTAANSEDKKYDYYAAGFAWEMKPFFIELDYLYNTYASRTTANETDKTSTVVGTLGGRMENWIAKLKVEATGTEVFTAANTSTNQKLMGYQAALEYLPTGDKTYRYHLVYVQKDQLPDVTGARGDLQTVQQVFAGVRLLADFLK